MAGRIILGTANPSLDANGKPVAGSTLTFYQNHTTTLQSVFSAIDLLTPLANPLPCDASGAFAEIWGPDSQPYSVKWSRPGMADITFDDIFPMSIANNNFFRFVDVVATTNIAVSSGLANGNTIDGQLLSTGMRVLLTAQSIGAENGIYDVPVAGAASRSADSNSAASIPNGTFIIAQRGANFKDTIWLHTTAVGFILGTTALTFQRLPKNSTMTPLFSGSGATYTTPAGVRQLRIRMWGGGGAGGSNSANATDGGAGGDTSFNGIVAKGGGGGRSSGAGGTGGTGGSGAGVVRFPGDAGFPGVQIGTGFSASASGGMGARGPLGGMAANGADAVSETGAAGSGGGASGFNGSTGGGGGGPEYVEIIINNPAASYTYTVGGAGTIANHATFGWGCNGASGLIVVDELY